MMESTSCCSIHCRERIRGQHTKREGQHIGERTSLVRLLGEVSTQYHAHLPRLHGTISGLGQKGNRINPSNQWITLATCCAGQRWRRSTQTIWMATKFRQSGRHLFW